jgi:hypothetical protein
MSRKHAELEREFIEDLEPRTGRSLAVWMSLIDDTTLTDRNAIIDWLRPQGLTFAHASWLERIHHNGGRPIYGEPSERPHPLAPQPPSISAPSATPAPIAKTAPARATTAPLIPAAATPALTRPLSVSPTPPLASANASVAELIARGKGLRPLADMLLREITQALPGLVTAAAGDLISLQRPREFGVLLVGPRELRLGLDLGDRPAEGPFIRSRIPGTSARISHMTAINDARQVGASLIELVQRADAMTNKVE